jgi:NAD-dependent deacetylase
MSIFFILGAGASVDSGLKTYRGLNSDNINYDDIVSFLDGNKWEENKFHIWNYYENFYKDVIKNKLGETYKLIEKICEKFPDSFVLTQNVDGFIKQINIPSVEIHGTVYKMKCIICKKIYDVNFENKYCSCGELCKPDIVLYNDNLEKNKIQDVFKLIKLKKPQYLIAIGTTMQFTYLKSFITHSNIPKINRYYINPDCDYECDIKEKFICETAYDGLLKFIEIINK